MLHFSQQFLFSQNFHQLHFLRQQLLQLSQQESQGQGSATGQAGQGVATGQGQGVIFSHGHGQGFEHGQAAKVACIPIDRATIVNNAINVFFIINFSFSIETITQV